jgi:hypothetical protein
MKRFVIQDREFQNKLPCGAIQQQDKFYSRSFCSLRHDSNGLGVLYALAQAKNTFWARPFLFICL